MDNDLIYLYCLVNKKLEGNDLLVVNKDLKLIEIDNFYCVVRYVSNTEFSEENFQQNANNIGWLDIKVREHLNVINSIMEIQTVIPFKFGTIFKSVTNIETFITEYADSLLQNFNTIGGKEEWSAKIYSSQNVLVGKIDELSEESAQLEAEIRQSSEGKAFFLRKKKTLLIENQVEKICNKYGQEYYDTFLQLSESTKLLPLTASDITGRKDTMILNATFLVQKENVAELIRSADFFQQRDEETGFGIELTGPWPPFSFISIKAKADA